MARISKTFNNRIVNHQQLQELFSNDIISEVIVGTGLEASLLNLPEYDEKNKTLFGHSLKWSQGNTITIETSTVQRATTYRTVNARPADFNDFVRASVIASMDQGRNLSLTETFSLAVKSLLKELGADSDGTSL